MFLLSLPYDFVEPPLYTYILVALYGGSHAEFADPR